MDNLRVLLLLFLSFNLSLASCKGPSKIGTHGRVSKKELAFRESIVERARDFLGSTYKYAGRDPRTGFDCSGFTHYVLNLYNVKVSPASKVQATEGKSVPLNEVKPGDLLFFSRSGKGGKVTHVALIVNRTEEGIFVIHSTNHGGVMVENVSKSNYWKPKILFARDVITGTSVIE